MPAIRTRVRIHGKPTKVLMRKVIDTVHENMSMTAVDIKDSCPSRTIAATINHEFVRGDYTYQGTIRTYYPRPQVLWSIENGHVGFILHAVKARALVWLHKGNLPPTGKAFGYGSKAPSQKLQGEGKGAAKWVRIPPMSPRPFMVPAIMRGIDRIEMALRSILR